MFDFKIVMNLMTGIVHVFDKKKFKEKKRNKSLKKCINLFYYLFILYC